MRKPEKLRAYSFKILPLVYTDALSYYEMLAKVIAKINEIIVYFGDNLISNIKAIINKAFLDATYNEATETLTLYFNTEEIEE